MIIDFHVHCFPDKLAPRAVSQLAANAGIPPRVDGTINGLKESMKRAGISKSVVLSIATKPTQTENINNWSAEIQDEEIIAFGSIHPDYENWKAELFRIKNMGLKGIKFHPDYQKFFVDDKKMFPIYETAFGLGLIVVFHAGVDIGLPAPYHATPERLEKIVRTFPRCKVVAAHMGGFSLWDDVERFLVGTDIYLDTSYSLDFMDGEQAKRIIRNHDVKKILFATDSPWADQKEAISKLKSLNLDKETEDAILGLNAKALLGL
ncbi:MAG TPA: amidohydrolase [Hungateiclostridium thermocellum]|uniref:Amidohydrolase 2 n=2 Tax=Acetivibrio thermocellus TaxID=1515 RepID=A3DIK7_ACET2|nr:amidohydrolase family protein [Acetivibrio thermocellus]ABN53786.1 amidohydrolase 2 [Acetivibrio thermocellus ATCC 27405]ADU73268.1 amidohydrolase 2 [Acetivibrio thermocellus DSM 1313]ALX07186.1 amidohydrolase 2 [Acetivibrio thermocellus AD2]ANV74922.1 amidohydrolase 2 [Acetivibrio thermocellus DSM 2360]EIC04348.1 amidohydrolase 2 [Acetivibrio thermocellus YS]